MIKVNKKYGIEVDQSGYQFGVITEQLDKKTNETVLVLRNNQYYPTMAMCLNGLVQQLQKDELQNADCDLVDAIKLMRKVNEDARKLIFDKISGLEEYHGESTDQEES